MGIVDLIKEFYKRIKGQIPVAKEIVGEYGESRGVHCPTCGVRIYPRHKAGELELCITCGQDFIVPIGAGKR